MARFSTPAILGAGLLVPSVFFLLVVFLKFAIGVDYLYDSLEKWFGPDPNSSPNIIAQAVVFFSPIAAFLVSAIPATRVKIGIERGQLVGSVTVMGSFLRVGTMAVSLAIIAIFALYIIAENSGEAAIHRYLGA